MNRLLVTICCLAFAFATGPVLAQDAGRFDLSPVQADLGTTPKVNLNFGPAMMAGFAETVRESKPELAEIIESIRGLRLMVFEDQDPTRVRDRMVQWTDRMGVEGWTPAMEVRDGDAHVDLFLIESDRFVEGMVLLVSESGGTVVAANLFGNLDPALVGRLISQGGVLDGLDFDSLNIQLGGDDETE